MLILEKLVSEIHRALDLDPAEEPDCVDLASISGEDDELGPITLNNLERGFNSLSNQAEF
jgi:hypothetical protein